jgi:hypothetical protein
LFRINDLFKTISKVLEFIVTLRLYNHAIHNNLIHPNQGRSLPGRSTSDVVATLTHKIELLQAASLKVSSLFFDIKGGFNNVRGPILAARLHAHDPPTYIVNSVLSFFSNKSCPVLFKGGPKILAAVDVGVLEA